MGITGTTAEEASKTISGSWNATKAAWKNLLVAFGNGQGVKQAIGNLVSTATTTVKNVIPVVKQALTGIAEFVKDVGPIIIQELPGLIQELLPELLSAAVSLVGALIQAIPGILSALWETIKTLFGTFMEWLRGQNPQLAAVLDGIIEAGAKVIDFFANFRENIAQVWSNIKETISEKIENIRESIASTFEEAKSAALTTWEDLKSGIQEKISAARDFIHEAIKRIKSFFDFEWHLPHLALPHFSISGSFSLNPPSVPHFSVDWYKKAYEQPYLFTSPTVVGNKGFGDGVGGEMVYGKNALMSDIREATNGGAVNEILTILRGMVGGKIPLNIELNITNEIDGATLARKTYRFNLAEADAHGVSLINA